MKQMFAFPMYASAAWLLWVLAQQTSSLGLGAALAGAILVAFAAWAYQKSKGTTAAGDWRAQRPRPRRYCSRCCCPCGWRASRAPRRPELGRPLRPPPERTGSPTMPHACRHSRRAARRSWSTSRPAGASPAWSTSAMRSPTRQVLKVFRQKGVTLMKGDWTNRDPAITQALARLRPRRRALLRRLQLQARLECPGRAAAVAHAPASSRARSQICRIAIQNRRPNGACCRDGPRQHRQRVGHRFPPPEMVLAVARVGGYLDRVRHAALAGSRHRADPSVTTQHLHLRPRRAAATAGRT